jgi:hypothetical protein
MRKRVECIHGDSADSASIWGNWKASARNMAWSRGIATEQIPTTQTLFMTPFERIRPQKAAVRDDSSAAIEKFRKAAVGDLYRGM